MILVPSDWVPLHDRAGWKTPSGKIVSFGQLRGGLNIIEGSFEEVSGVHTLERGIASESRRSCSYCGSKVMPGNCPNCGATE